MKEQIVNKKTLRLYDQKIINHLDERYEARGERDESTNQILTELIKRGYEELAREQGLRNKSDRTEMYPEQHPTVSFCILNDEELIARIQSSRFGKKFERLLNGDCSDYSSRSEADFAFICAMSRWTKNLEQIERIYRNSGLYRGKWDERRGNRTYGEITLEHAFEVSK